MQYLACKFPSSPRRYAYAYDGEPAAKVGDKCDVPTQRGPITVEIVDVLDEKPADLADIEIKAIVLLRTKPQAEAGALGADTSPPGRDESAEHHPSGPGGPSISSSGRKTHVT